MCLHIAKTMYKQVKITISTQADLQCYALFDNSLNFCPFFVQAFLFSNFGARVLLTVEARTVTPQTDDRNLTVVAEEWFTASRHIVHIVHTFHSG